jgi:hypothetical protein
MSKTKILKVYEAEGVSPMNPDPNDPSERVSREPEIASNLIAGVMKDFDPAETLPAPPRITAHELELRRFRLAIARFSIHCVKADRTELAAEIMGLLEDSSRRLP